MTKKYNDPFGFNKAINWDKLEDPKVLKELEELLKKKKKMKRIKHNDLTHYFLRPHRELPRKYLASCEKFFKSIKQQAIDKQQASSYSRIIKEK